MRPPDSYLPFGLAIATLTGAVLSLQPGMASSLRSPGPTPDTIAFGSCLRQGRNQPVWDAIVRQNPDLFLFLGDNIYADTRDPEVMRAGYARLAADPGYRRLSGISPVLATWDDHDYGENDAGAEYPMKQQSERIFLDFFGVPPGAPSHMRAGIYSAHLFGQAPRRVQVLMFDTRYFRGPLTRSPPDALCPRGGYTPNEDPGSTLLGEAQWRWLAGELEKPAELRLLVSSIQVIPYQHCYEKWSNLPLERERLFRLIRDSGANGIIILSGDRHHAEISRLPPEVIGFPLYEVTASGMNTARRGKTEPNRYRTTARSFREDHFGVIAIDWDHPDPVVALRIMGLSGRVAMEQTLRLGELSRQNQLITQ